MGGDVVSRERTARFSAEAYVTPENYQTRLDWIDALDEALSDHARAYGFEPSVTLRAVLEELMAA